ncbi:MAG: FtsX-like permease family protein [Clostridiaceae bacterium]
MNWLNIFKIYNVRNLKKEKLLLFFTMISILITTTLSIVVPIISTNMDNYNKKSIREANGGDLFIQCPYEAKVFNEEITKLKEEGAKVTYNQSTSAFFQKSSEGKFYGNLILGERDLKDDEIVLSSSMAKNLSVKVGDKVNIKAERNSKEYTVKEIEAIPKGVSNDTSIIGYGKVNKSVSTGDLIYIEKGTDGEGLKSRLKSKEDGFVYSSIKDKESELINDTNIQIATFGILTTMGYILSSVAIITTSIMLIVRRKRDISIMKLLSLRNKDIKNALRIELSIIILIPVILSIITSNIVAASILKMNFIPYSTDFITVLNIVAKGIILNIVFFEIFSNLPLLIIDDFKGLWLLRESEDKNGVIKKRIFVYLILLIPIMLVIYTIYIGNQFNLVTSVSIIALILIFFVVSSILMKVFSSFNYKSKLLMYSSKNIKKNFLTFILLIVSFSITLVFIMITISLNTTVEKSMSKSLSTVLPYNYRMANSENLNIEKLLTKENEVEGYTKVYNSIGKVLNQGIEYKTIGVNEVKKEDYNIQFKMVEGESLFQGEDGCLITSGYQKQNKLKVGDILHVYYEEKVIDVKIKGVYDGSIIDSQSILLPYRGDGKHIEFYIKSFGEKWINQMGDNPIISVDVLGSAVSLYVDKFIRIFKGLSILVVFASLIFNINLLNITFAEERKEETVIRALGLGKSFICRVYMLKGSVLTIISAMLSYGLYFLLSKLLLTMLGVDAVYSSSDVFLLILCSMLLTVATFGYPFITMIRYNSFKFLREN